MLSPGLSLPLSSAWAYEEPAAGEHRVGLFLQLPCCGGEGWLQLCDLISDLWLLVRFLQDLLSPPAVLSIHKWWEIQMELSSLGLWFPWIERGCSASLPTEIFTQHEWNMWRSSFGGIRRAFFRLRDHRLQSYKTNLSLLINSLGLKWQTFPTLSPMSLLFSLLLFFCASQPLLHFFFSLIVVWLLFICLSYWSISDWRLAYLQKHFVGTCLARAHA